MNYAAFCDALGLEPREEIRQIYEGTADLEAPLDTTWVTRLMPETAGELLRVAEEITRDPVKLRYVNLLRACYWTLPENLVPLLPQGEGKDFENVAPLLVLLSFAGQAEEEMERRGLPEEQCRWIRGSYERSLLSRKRLLGYFAVTPTSFFWQRRFLIPNLFLLRGLEFEIKKMTGQTTIYRETGTGKLLGLREEQETETSFVCTRILRGGEEGGQVVLSKDSYSRYVCLGDDVIAIHIPKGAKIDPATLDQACAEALEFFARYYPDRSPKCFYCGSWLLDPTLADYLSPTSNIIQFQRRFCCYCVKSTGREVFSFVHPQHFDSYEDLPENTSLERMLKKRYLAGDPVYVHSGICPFH